MTTITLPRATVEQALEAMRCAVPTGTITLYEWDKAVSDLNAALAQQAEPVLQTCNCRWDGEVQVQQCALHEAHVDAIHEWAERAKAAERKLAQQAEPVAPVGRVVSANCEYATVQWLKQTSDVGGGDPKNSRSWPIAGDAVYTAPQQRKPLTEEEIVEAVREADLDWQAGWTLDEHQPNRFITLARAIERARGIKE